MSDLESDVLTVWNRADEFDAEAGALISDAKDMRSAAVLRLLENGWTTRAAGKLLGVSAMTVSNLARRGTE